MSSKTFLSLLDEKWNRDSRSNLDSKLHDSITINRFNSHDQRDTAMTTPPDQTEAPQEVTRTPAPIIANLLIALGVVGGILFIIALIVTFSSLPASFEQLSPKYIWILAIPGLIIYVFYPQAGLYAKYQAQTQHVDKTPPDALPPQTHADEHYPEEYATWHETNKLNDLQ